MNKQISKKLKEFDMDAYLYQVITSCSEEKK